MTRPLGIIFLTIFVNLVGFGIIVPLLPFYAGTFGASPLTIGLLFAVFSLCQLVAAPALGDLSDRYGRRPVLVFSLAGTVVSFVMLALAHSIALLFAARIVDGLSGGNISTARAYVSRSARGQPRGGGIGIRTRSDACRAFVQSRTQNTIVRSGQNEKNIVPLLRSPRERLDHDVDALFVIEAAQEKNDLALAYDGIPLSKRVPGWQVLELIEIDADREDAASRIIRVGTGELPFFGGGVVQARSTARYFILESRLDQALPPSMSAIDEGVERPVGHENIRSSEIPGVSSRGPVVKEIERMNVYHVEIRDHLAKPARHGPRCAEESGPTTRQRLYIEPIHTRTISGHKPAIRSNNSHLMTAARHELGQSQAGGRGTAFSCVKIRDDVQYSHVESS